MLCIFVLEQQVPASHREDSSFLADSRPRHWLDLGSVLVIFVDVHQMMVMEKKLPQQVGANKPLPKGRQFVLGSGSFLHLATSYCCIVPSDEHSHYRCRLLSVSCLSLLYLDNPILFNMPYALVIDKAEGKPGKVYHPLKNIEQPEPQPKDNEVVVKITAAALNHRDLFIRQGLYGAIGFGVPLLADGCGVVVKTGSSPEAKRWMDKRVVLNPGHGWKDDADGPESPTGYAILGGTKLNPLGTAVEYLSVDSAEIEEAPKHLTSAEAAALPLAGLTAWRATMTKSQNAKPGRNILVTGIGGGVAVMSLLYAVAAGANVYVSSGSQAKIDKAISLGAKGGVNYKEQGWEKKLLAMLPKDRKKLDAIIDGAGGDVAEKGAKLLRVRWHHGINVAIID